MIGIKPKHFWPGLIIALLMSSVIFWVGMLYVAHANGGPQVVDEYYEDDEVSGGAKEAAPEPADGDRREAR